MPTEDKKRNSHNQFYSIRGNRMNFWLKQLDSGVT